MKIFLSFSLCFMSLFFLACGYAPISKISKDLFGEKVYVGVEISQADPRTSVFITDTLREVLINKLGKSTADKDEADDFIYVKMENLYFTPIVYDENGYVIAYRVKLTLNFNVRFADGRTRDIKTSGTYDFSILPNSIISDSLRLDAVRSASNEAFDEFISVLAVKGAKNGKY